MSGQSRLNVDLTGLVIGGVPIYSTGTLAEDSGRSTDLAQFTVLAYDTTNENWVPLTDIDALDGTNVPSAIYVGPAVAAASIAAGDVELGADTLLIGGRGVIVDKNKLVLENSLTLASICLYVDTGGTNGSLGTIEQNLRKLGIFMGDIVDASSYENS